MTIVRFEIEWTVVELLQEEDDMEAVETVEWISGRNSIRKQCRA